jgi:hypothetical protein
VVVNLQASAAERCAALNNISACRLALRQYTACIQDCTAALEHLLDTAAAAVEVGHPQQQAATAAEGSSASSDVVGYARQLVQQAVAAATAHSTGVGNGGMVEPPVVAGDSDVGVDAVAGTAAAADEPPGSIQLTVAMRGQLQSMVKLLGRMAVACGYLKRGAATGAVYQAAEQLAGAAGLQQAAQKMQQERQQLAAHLRGCEHGQ